MAYTITYNSNGGSSVSQATGVTTLPSTLPTTTKAGYTFVAWYIDSALTTRAVAGATIEEDTTLYAKWHNLGSLFTEIADAIRSKDGTSENIRDVDFGERVNAIQGAKEEQTKTVTPNFSSGNVDVTPTTGKVMTQVTVVKDSNLIPENIKSGVTIFGITGTLEPAPTGYEVEIHIDRLRISGCNSSVEIYDGENSSGILLGTIPYSDISSLTRTYTITSGYIYLYCDGDGAGQYWISNPSASGGVAILNYNSDQEKFEIKASVSGDGTLDTGEYWCFVKGTKITLADGTTKNVEDITYDDKLLTWNFDEGRLDTADIFWIAKESKAPLYWEVTFSDNTKLGLVGAKNKSHRLFNLEQGKFAYPQDFNEGEHTIKEDGSLVTITSCVKLQKEVTYYNLATSKRLNNYANGILTGCRFTNIYPIENMKYVKDNRQLVSREEYAEIPDNYFEGLRLAEQPLDTQNGDVNYFNTTKEHVIHNYIEHEKNWQGAKDYKQWEFKKGRNEN
jgi:uncharacterized repeat protein (TIGR02543 family)